MKLHNDSLQYKVEELEASNETLSQKLKRYKEVSKILNYR